MRAGFAQHFLAALALTLVLMAVTIAQTPDRNIRRTPIVRAVETILPCVVNINTQKIVRRRRVFDDFFDYGDNQAMRRQGQLQNYSLGSGVIIDEKGYVITNDHVVRRADRVSVNLHDGRELEATVIGTDVHNDIAILKINTTENLPAARLARSNDLMMGETTIAVGNPFGLGGSVTEGILSAKNRRVNFQGKKVFQDYIQTSTVINPGNSGGPLINLNGEVIGINVAIHSRGPGIGFAIPVSRVRDVVYSVMHPRLTKNAAIGFDLNHNHEGRGAVVRTIDPKGPAALAGLQAGDVILSVNGQEIIDWIDFQTTMQEMKIGHAFDLELRRADRRKKTTLALAPSPPSPRERAFFDFVGFEFKDVPANRRNAMGGLHGVLVTKVLETSKAKSVGIRAGDLIYSLGNIEVTDKKRAMNVILRFRQSKSIPLHLFRPTDGDHYGGELPFNR